MANLISWPGRSGRSYQYAFVDMSRPFNTVAGNYVFAKQMLNGRFVPLYFGETSDFSGRMPSHEVWQAAIAMGATHAMAHTTQGGELVRRAEERDLIEGWNPPLNVQYRTTG